jgi:hypothetical protein
MATNPVCAPIINAMCTSKVMVQDPAVKQELAHLAAAYQTDQQQLPTTQASVDHINDDDFIRHNDNDSILNFNDEPEPLLCIKMTTV